MRGPKADWRILILWSARNEQEQRISIRKGADRAMPSAGEHSALNLRNMRTAEAAADSVLGTARYEQGQTESARAQGEADYLHEGTIGGFGSAASWLFPYAGQPPRCFSDFPFAETYN